MNEQELKDFTIEVFNYFNGRINKINTDIKLIIDDTDKRNCIAYYTISKIYININFIKKYYDNIKEVIIETIIHELYHVDQIIDDYKYTENLYYTNSIENAVKYISSKFIKDNLEEINNKFNVSMYYSILPYTEYKSYKNKKQYLNYILNLLDDNKDKDYNQILNTAYNINLNIIYEDKNISFLIKRDNVFITEFLYLLEPLVENNPILKYRKLIRIKSGYIDIVLSDRYI